MVLEVWDDNLFLVFSCSLIVVSRLAFKTCLHNDISIVSISQRYGHTSKGLFSLFLDLRLISPASVSVSENYSIRISFSCIIILTSYVFLLYKKRTLLFKFVYRWKLKILGSLKSFGILWGCRTNDYLQFSSWIFYYFIPHIFQLRKFFSTWLKSLKWIQLLCDYINSPRVVLFCHKLGFGFTLPKMKSIESFSIVLRKYILYLLSKKIVTIFSTD